MEFLGTGEKIYRGLYGLFRCDEAHAFLVMRADTAVTKSAGNIVIQEPVRNLPGSPLLRWVREREQGNNWGLDRRGHMHRAGVIRHDKIGRLNQRTELFK